MTLIAERPRNGYQLIKEIEARSAGAWRPSPGAIYPALAKLAKDELICARDLQGGRVFEITRAGRTRIAGRDPTLPAPWEAMRSDRDEAVAALLKQFEQMEHAVVHVASAGTAENHRRAASELRAARESLRRVVGGSDRDSP